MSAQSEWNSRNREACRAAQRRWRERNPDKARARSAAYRQQDPQAARDRCASWRLRNPDKVRDWADANQHAIKLAKRANSHNRRGAPGKLHKAEVEWLLTQPCAYCGAASDHADHCHPLSRGGHNTVANCVGACAQCNLSKGKKTVLEFIGLWPT